eukprot:CAMPEP_0181291880 /NCGR_PEP_ID=MMETSP1101-20121128/2206_1 /TAXON_ID=46948 /ORGANISM="Rhodomonas abbreviata, Strain Caron Lab Isolate" /LENGTH=355 /DNA_ID=CAMNT_0023396307 /DNA_START=175 /DNA_END=1242 /DNA_ORIENTATION=+
MSMVPSFDLSLFSPVPSGCGGLVLGACSLSYIFFTGQVLGLSGGIRGFFLDDWKAKAPFVSGLFAGAVIVKLLAPGFLQPLPGIYEAGMMYRMGLGGLMVGYGTALANGCTSGHGITGLSRFSLRSLVAVGTFLWTAITVGTQSGMQLTFPKLAEGVAVANVAGVTGIAVALGVIGASLLALIPLHKKKILDPSVVGVAAKFLSLCGFAVGLCLSGMAQPGKLAGFLDLSTAWDPSLLFVLGGAHLLHTPLMQLWLKIDSAKENRPRPLLAKDFACRLSDRFHLDTRLAAGAAIFGYGWALSSLCPGPGIVVLLAPSSVSSPEMLSALLWNVAFVVGGVIDKFTKPKPLQKPAQP